MTEEMGDRCTAFSGNRRLASGSYAEVARRLRVETGGTEAESVLVFDDDTGRQIDFDLRGSPDEVSQRYAAAAAEEGRGGVEREAKRRGPGRPKLGVVSKEVTLLPRHWAWLGAQRGGASATLRRLVDEARHAGREAERTRAAQDAAYRFAAAMAGNLQGFEEATRALYAGDGTRFEEEIASWPEDVRDHVRTLAALGKETATT